MSEPKFNHPKLPKQWRYWVKKAGLKIDGRESIHDSSLIGRNRVWRVDCSGNLEVSCPLEHFDRWSNSSGAEMKLPRSEKEFLASVKELLHLSKDAI